MARRKTRSRTCWTRKRKMARVMLFAKEAVEKREYTKRKAVVVAVKGAEPDADAGVEDN